MKGKKVNRLIPILLLIFFSEFLLSILLFNWLRSEYKTEKSKLKADLVRNFNEAEQNAQDSVLFRNLINPVFQEIKVKSSSSFSYKFSNSKVVTENVQPGKKIIVLSDDNGQNKTQIIENSVISKDRKSLNKTVFVSSFNNDTTQKSGGLVAEIKMPENPDEKFFADTTILINGMKLLLDKFSDSPDLETKISFPFDSLMIEKLFNEKVAGISKKLETKWRFDQKLDTNSKKIIIASSSPFYNYSVEILNANYFIFQQILPEILFALTILVSISLAFLFVFGSLRKQMQLSELREDLINNITHELKTPVSTVKVALETMRNYNVLNDRTKTEDYLNMANLEMIRLEMLINSVLNNSLLEENKLQLNFKTENLSEIIEGAINTLQLKIEQKGAKIFFKRPEKEIFYSIDQLHFQGVLINLIDNSLKYAEKEPRIEIKLANFDSYYLLSVSDNGTGIPEDYKTKVFEKFFRIPKGNVHNVKGHGLGLNYAQKIVSLHKGKIWVENNENKGCTFFIQLKK